jgi:hypothetical protein
MSAGTNHTLAPVGCQVLGGSPPRKIGRPTKVRVDGLSLKELSALSGVDANVLRQRIVVYGWDVERAVRTPTRKYWTRNGPPPPESRRHARLRRLRNVAKRSARNEVAGQVNK